jgi:hypothetical protein
LDQDMAESDAPAAPAEPAAEDPAADAAPAAAPELPAEAVAQAGGWEKLWDIYGISTGYEE